MFQINVENHLEGVAFIENRTNFSFLLQIISLFE